MRQSLSRLGRTAIVVPGILTALTLTGCKDDQGTASQPSDQASQPASSSPPVSSSPGSSAPVSTPPSPPSGSGKTDLTITVRMSPNAQPITRTLKCDPP